MSLAIVWSYFHALRESDSEMEEGDESSHPKEGECPYLKSQRGEDHDESDDEDDDDDEEPISYPSTLTQPTTEPLRWY
jgi:hypothetical protein